MDFSRNTYKSSVDGMEDWYMFHEGSMPLCVVVLHGHGSHGDQLIRRSDLYAWRDCLGKLDASVLCPNLRDNSWMSAPAVEDLASLLRKLKAKHGWRSVIIASGSMGGTGALIFAVRHPELVDGIVALGAATSLRSYIEWCAQPGRRTVVYEIRDAILNGYHTEDSLDEHDVRAQCEKLTMPVFYYHGGADQLIPVSEAQALGDKMGGCPNFHLRILPDGDHDSPLPYFRECVLKLLNELNVEISDAAKKPSC